MFCKNCGHEIPEGAGFCPDCGTAVDYTYQPQGTDQSQNVYQSQSVNQTQNTDYSAQQDYAQSVTQTSYQTSYESSAKTSKGGMDWDEVIAIMMPHLGCSPGSCMVWVACVVGILSIMVSPNFYSIYSAGRTGNWILTYMDNWIFFLLVFIVISVVTIFNLYIVDVLGAVVLFILTCSVIGTGISETVATGYAYTFYLRIGADFMFAAILTIVIGSVFGVIQSKKDLDS